ncbi:Chymotrypsinogen 2 [Galemys pyrenaicus]|uniref:Chymotrypsinogen 2 n=1 Tax=Galemys pyrenaicus TaxID=202257 RepID=A0A8J6ACK2_GALPY|nr:Chymotrypsinogen 2 [Galemys pyrenaicus]
MEPPVPLHPGGDRAAGRCVSPSAGAGARRGVGRGAVLAEGAARSLQTVWTSPTSPPLSPPGSGAPAGDPELSIMPRILNGMDAVTVYPWHVSLEKSSGKPLCGGSLISRNWVITVANCRVRARDWAVAGLHDRRAYGNKIQYIKISKVIRHPEFNNITLYADLALLKLTTNVAFYRTVAPIALPMADDTFPVGSECKIMGWGYIRHNRRRKPDKLQEATVPILSNTECVVHYGDVFQSDMICVGANGVACWKVRVLSPAPQISPSQMGNVPFPCSGAPAGDPELSIMPRILNGMDAVTMYPWHVSLEKPFGWTLCGGSLIDRKWVITVATCRVRANDWAIAGKHDPRGQRNKIQYIKINRVFRHPNFNISSFYANIALLKLNSKVGIRRTVAPIALPRADYTFTAGSQCKIMGWGLTRPDGRRFPDVLQEATVPILSNTECVVHYGDVFQSDMICVGANGVSCWKVRVLSPAPQISPSQMGNVPFPCHVPCS